MWLTFKSVDFVKQITLCNVSGPLFNQLKTFRGKDWSPLRKKDLCFQKTLDLSYIISSSLGLQPTSLPCKFQTRSPHYGVNHFLFLSLPLFFSLSLFLFPSLSRLKKEKFKWQSRDEPAELGCLVCYRTIKNHFQKTYLTWLKSSCR